MTTTHHDVEATELCDSGIDQSLDLRFLGYIAFDGDSFRSGEALANDLGGLVHRCFVHVRKDYARALGGELERRLEADTATDQLQVVCLLTTRHRSRWRLCSQDEDGLPLW